MRHISPKVYVGIVTYNSASFIHKCIHAVLRQSHKNITVIILDNNSVDDIDQIIKRYDSKIIFIKNAHNIGFGGGHNKIIRSVKLQRDEYYLALNPDAILDPDCIKKLVEGARRHNADWATGKLYKDIGTHTLYSVGHAMNRDGYAFNIGYGNRDSGKYNIAREVFGAAGAAALYKGSMVQAVSVSGNFFDPALFMYYEDVDVDWRATLLGLHCWYVPNATVYHPGGTFPAHLEADVLANRFLSIIKNAFWKDLVFYNFPVICVHVIARLIFSPKVGIRIVMRLLKDTSGALRRRTKAVIARQIVQWLFTNASQEISNSPTTLAQRMRAFVGRIFQTPKSYV